MAGGKLFTCSSARAEDHAVVTACGDLDLHSAPRVRSALRRLLDDDARHIVLDLSDVHFVDSTALGVILGAMAQASLVHGRILVVTADERVLQVFRLTRLDEVVPLFHSLEEAESALPAPALREP